MIKISRTQPAFKNTHRRNDIQWQTIPNVDNTIMIKVSIGVETACEFSMLNSVTASYIITRFKQFSNGCVTRVVYDEMVPVIVYKKVLDNNSLSMVLQLIVVFKFYLITIILLKFKHEIQQLLTILLVSIVIAIYSYW